MEHIEHTAQLAAYLPLVMGALAGACALVMKFVGQEHLDRMVLDGEPDPVVSCRTVPEGGGCGERDPRHCLTYALRLHVVDRQSGKAGVGLVFALSMLAAVIAMAVGLGG